MDKEKGLKFSEFSPNLLSACFSGRHQFWYMDCINDKRTYVVPVHIIVLNCPGWYLDSEQ